MKKHLIPVAIALSLSAPAAFAQDDNDLTRQEAIGFGSGAVLGAAFGGPVGAFVGGIVGLMIGDDINDDQQLVAANQALDKREQQFIALQRELSDVRQHAAMQLVSLDTRIDKIQQPHQATLQFRTGSAELAPHYRDQLDLMASTLKENPDLALQIAGYADARGEQKYNLDLSQQRAEAVRDYLVKQGVKPAQLSLKAFGEQDRVSSSDVYDELAFDRRVVLQLAESEALMTASNP